MVVTLPGLSGREAGRTCWGIHERKGRRGPGGGKAVRRQGKQEARSRVFFCFKLKQKTRKNYNLFVYMSGERKENRWNGDGI